MRYLDLVEIWGYAFGLFSPLMPQSGVLGDLKVAGTLL